MAGRSAVVVMVLLLAPVAGAYTYDPADHPRVTTRAVQGHTVRAEIQSTFCGFWADEFDVEGCGDAGGRTLSPAIPASAPSVALPRDVGVAWTNDQRLVAASGTAVAVLVGETILPFDPPMSRNPCGGWIFVTASGMSDPRSNIGLHQYVDSYQVIDPNDNYWIVDHYTLGAPGTDIWTVPVLMYDIHDLGPVSGVSCAPLVDAAGGSDEYNAVVYLPPGAGRPAGLVSSGTPEDSHGANPMFADAGDAHLHAAADVDLYYSNVEPLFIPQRTYTVEDTEGASAPYDDRAASQVPTVQPDAPDVRAPPTDPVVDPTSGSRFGRLTGNSTDWQDFAFDACFDPDEEGARSTCLDVADLAEGAEISFTVLGARVAPAGILACFYREQAGAWYVDCTSHVGDAAVVDVPEALVASNGTLLSFTVDESIDVVYRIDGADRRGGGGAEAPGLAVDDHGVEAGGTTRVGRLDGADDSALWVDACVDPSREGRDSTCIEVPAGATSVTFERLNGDAEIGLCARWWEDLGWGPYEMYACWMESPGDAMTMEVPPEATHVGAWVSGPEPSLYRLAFAAS